MSKFIKDQIIQISAINEKIKKIATYKENASAMHIKKFFNQVAKEFADNGMCEYMLWRDTANQMARIYRTCRNANR